MIPLFTHDGAFIVNIAYVSIFANIWTKKIFNWAIKVPSAAIFYCRRAHISSIFVLPGKELGTIKKAAILRLSICFSIHFLQI